MSRGRDVLKDGRFRVDVVHNDVQSSITVEIAYGHAARAPGLRQGAPWRRAYTFEFPGAQIAKQQRLLSVTRTPLMLVNRRIDMPVSHKQVFPTIVVVIQECRAPSEKRKRDLTEPRLIRDIREIA